MPPDSNLAHWTSGTVAFKAYLTHCQSTLQTQSPLDPCRHSMPAQVLPTPRRLTRLPRSPSPSMVRTPTNRSRSSLNGPQRARGIRRGLKRQRFHSQRPLPETTSATTPAARPRRRRPSRRVIKACADSNDEEDPNARERREANAESQRGTRRTTGQRQIGQRTAKSVSR